MQITNIQTFIEQSIKISSGSAEAIANKFEPLIISKNQFLIKENEMPLENYILESGIIRSFTLDSSGSEVTTNLFSPFCFVNDVLAFFNQQPVSESFQTITDCKLWKMSYTEVQTNFHNIPEFREFGRMMLIKNYNNLKTRMLGMIKDPAELRYTKLIEQNPLIIKEVPLKIIASYLGITDTSLSRIRNKIAS